MKEPRVLERTIENAVVAYAKKCYRLEVVKLNGMGKQALPDRMFLGPNGTVMFIEFKRPGGKATPLQRHLHSVWKRHGHPVHLVDSVQHGKNLVDGLMRGKVPELRDDLLYPLEDK